MADVLLDTTNEDGDDVTHTLHVEDEHVDDDRDVLQHLATRAEEQAALSSENETLRETIVSDVVRRKKLAGEVGEDADISEDEEHEYLMGLPADRLQREWERAPSGEEMQTEPATDPSKEPSASVDAYDEKGL